MLADRIILKTGFTTCNFANPYVMRKPKTSFLYYFNKFMPLKLFIYNNKVLVNMQISSVNWSIPCKKSSTRMPEGMGIHVLDLTSLGHGPQPDVKALGVDVGAGGGWKQQIVGVGPV